MLPESHIDTPFVVGINSSYFLYFDQLGISRVLLTILKEAYMTKTGSSCDI